MCSRFAPEAGADSATTYRVPLRALDSDHTFSRHIRVYGPNDLRRQLDELRLEHAGYSIGTPVEEAE
jgi:hypothetical protein